MTAFEIAGWLGNACFFSRFLVQWRLSERAGRSVAPAVFWWLSLCGSIALGAYAEQRGELVLLAGYGLNAAIYARNLRLQHARPRAAAMRPGALASIAAGAATALAALAWSGIAEEPGGSAGWLACAIVGQVVWSSRFVLQWWISEQRGHSHFPPIFWWTSLVGNALLLAYALHLGDAIFAVGFLPGPIVQLRNLVLCRAASAARGALRES